MQCLDCTTFHFLWCLRIASFGAVTLGLYCDQTYVRYVEHLQIIYIPFTNSPILALGVSGNVLDLTSFSLKKYYIK